ncbi:MAG: hypothetical protein ACK5ZG_10945 [Phycisphaerae bacterium]
MRWVRAILLGIVFVLAGAGLQSLVAWVLYLHAIRSGLSTVPMGIHVAPLGSWPDASIDWPAPHVGSVHDFRVDATTHLMRAVVTADGLARVNVAPDLQVSAYRVRIGVPMRNLEHEQRSVTWTIAVPAGYPPASRVDNSGTVPLLGSMLPVRPVWRGMVVNTALYAVLAYGMFVGTRTGWRRFGPQRRRRIARGCCPACGYERRGIAASAMCPECGA